MTPHTPASDTASSVCDEAGCRAQAQGQASCDEDIRRAARRLAEGGLVAFPTETVYGLGADAENPEAIGRIYAVKGRPANHPVIVHVAPEADIDYWAASVPTEGRLLIEAFWPGPLTLILPRAAHIPAAVSGGQDSVGLRCPSHPLAQALLREFAALKPNGQGGVAAPSANKFGQVSPTQAIHVRNEFPELSEAELMVLEGGSSEVGIESTIVDVSRIAQGIGPVLLRPGHISADDLSAALGTPVGLPDKAAPRVSGSLKAHYAPRTPLFIRSATALFDETGNASPEAGRIAVVSFAPAPQALGPHVDWLVCSADPAVYARDLYALLRRLDACGYARILLEAPPRSRAWQAVNDRIGRAAAAF
jgi:L-threonylcarbamoyladenylate synthase